MRKIILVVPVVLMLGGCWGSDSPADPRVEQVIEYVRSNCGWVVEAASVAAMLTAPNPAVAPGVKTIGNAICSALAPPQVQTLFGWGESPPCPRVNGVCIEAERDGSGE